MHPPTKASLRGESANSINMLQDPCSKTPYHSLVPPLSSHHPVSAPRLPNKTHERCLRSMSSPSALVNAPWPGSCPTTSGTSFVLDPVSPAPCFVWITAGVQNELPQDGPLGHADNFEPKTIKAQKAQEETLTSLKLPKNLEKFRKCAILVDSHIVNDVWGMGGA